MKSILFGVVISSLKFLASVKSMSSGGVFETSDSMIFSKFLPLPISTALSVSLKECVVPFALVNSIWKSFVGKILQELKETAVDKSMPYFVWI